MMRFGFALGLLGATALGAIAPADAALVHDYEFSAPGAVLDTAGTADGTLLGGATVSGGALHLDGISGYVDFGSFLVPTGGSAYSIFIRVDGQPFGGGFAEMISQGQTGGTGIYLGIAQNGNIRATDYHFDTGVAFPYGQHDFLFSTQPGASRLYVDGALVFSTADQAIAYTNGSTTRFGRQFAPYNEFFRGDIDAIRIYDSVEAPAVPEPATWALMIGGFAVVGGAMRRARGVARAFGNA